MDQPTNAAAGSGIRRLAGSTAVATLVLIAMGGAVRATDSGLACPDWPACYGQWIPPADLNIWLEHSHRLWAGVVALAILVLIIATGRRRNHDRWAWRASVLAGLLVLVQAGLGAIVVLLKLRAELVTAHLAMSFIVVALLIIIARRDAAQPHRHGSTTRVQRLAAGVAGLVFAQAALGSHATGHAAAYVFDAFPIWRTTDTWTATAGQVLHVAHRAGGYVVAAAVIAFALAVHRAATTRSMRRFARLAVVLVTVQVALGVANVLTNATEWSAISHLAVASWLWATFIAAATPMAVDDAPSPSPVHALEEVVA
ncbi:MAG: COX15/CtaA family protein [Nitriliruptoraceae bacterium]